MCLNLLGVWREERGAMKIKHNQKNKNKTKGYNTSKIEVK